MMQARVLYLENKEKEVSEASSFEGEEFSLSKEVRGKGAHKILGAFKNFLDDFAFMDFEKNTPLTKGNLELINKKFEEKGLKKKTILYEALTNCEHVFFAIIASNTSLQDATFLQDKKVQQIFDKFFNTPCEEKDTQKKKRSSKSEKKESLEEESLKPKEKGPLIFQSKFEKEKRKKQFDSEEVDQKSK